MADKQFEWSPKLFQKCRKGSDQFLNTRILPIGIPVIDHVLGGGWGLGRFIELYGNFASGKSAIVYYTLAKVQTLGGIGYLIDTEGAFDRNFFIDLGGDPEAVVFPEESEIDCVEGIFTFMERTLKELMQYGKDSPPVVIAWDSIAQSRTKHLATTGMSTIDLSRPKCISQGVDLVSPLVRQTNCALIGINQTIENIGSNDSAKLTPGGRKWKYASSQRLELQYDGGSKTSLIVDETTKDVIGRKIKGRVEKSRMGASQREFTLAFYTADGYKHPIFGTPTRKGIDIDEALFDYYYSDGSFYLGEAKERVIQSKGAGWYWLHKSIDPEEKKFRAAAWPEVLEKNPKLRRLLYDDLEIDPDVLNSAG